MLEDMYRFIPGGAYYGEDLNGGFAGLGDCGPAPVLSTYQQGLSPCTLGQGSATATCLAQQNAAAQAFLNAQQNWQACQGDTVSSAGQLVTLPDGSQETLAAAAAGIYANPASTLSPNTLGNLQAAVLQYGSNIQAIQAGNPQATLADIYAAEVQINGAGWCGVQCNDSSVYPGYASGTPPASAPLPPAATVAQVAASVAAALPGATVSQLTNAVQSAMPSASPTQVAAAVQAAAPNAPTTPQMILPVSSPVGTTQGGNTAGTTPPASVSLPPAGNSQATAPSSTSWCFPGDTSPQIASGVPICQMTAFGALAALLLVFVVAR